MALHSTILWTSTHPLLAIHLSKSQAEQIISILSQYGLLAMGICRTFPCQLVFASKDYFGLGIQHFYTAQEILWLKDIIKHQNLDTATGQLHTISIELLHIELGSVTQLSNISFSAFSQLVIDSLVKSTWQFLSSADNEFKTSIYFPPQHKNDSIIMQHICEFSEDPAQLAATNKCGLFLKAFFLSDISDGSGVDVLDEAWTG